MPFYWQAVPLFLESPAAILDLTEVLVDLRVTVQSNVGRKPQVAWIPLVGQPLFDASHFDQ